MHLVTNYDYQRISHNIDNSGTNVSFVGIYNYFDLYILYLFYLFTNEGSFRFRENLINLRNKHIKL